MLGCWVSVKPPACMNPSKLSLSPSLWTITKPQFSSVLLTVGGTKSLQVLLAHHRHHVRNCECVCFCCKDGRFNRGTNETGPSQSFNELTFSLLPHRRQDLETRCCPEAKHTLPPERDESDSSRRLVVFLFYPGYHQFCGVKHRRWLILINWHYVILLRVTLPPETSNSSIFQGDWAAKLKEKVH